MESDSEFERQQEAAAAAEAAKIGGEPGKVPGYDDDPTTPGISEDPARRPVEEAGGGEAEGFEAAEEALIENATHGDGRGEPSGDAFTPEVEADAVTAVDGEADAERVSEKTDDEEDR
jgi:hypothetical protein